MAIQQSVYWLLFQWLLLIKITRVPDISVQNATGTFLSNNGESDVEASCTTFTYLLSVLSQPSLRIF